MKPARTAAVGALLLSAVGLSSWLLWPRLWPAPRGPAHHHRHIAAATSAALVAGVHAARPLVEPYRCARPREAAPTLRIQPARKRSAHIAIVADARGQLDQLERVRDQFADRHEQRPLDLLVSLGGMAHDQDDIQAALSVLTGPWPVLALPGDRESYPAHRQAVAALTDRGVHDGAQVRAIDIAGVAVLATLPGAARVERTLAGVDGCVYTDEDVAHLAALLPSPTAESDPARVLIAHAPPRQRGPAATDLTAAGVHIGDRALALALPEARIALAIHGLLARADVPPTGRAAFDAGNPVILGAGAADGIADITQYGKWPPPALLITLDPGSVTWTYLER